MAKTSATPKTSAPAAPADVNAGAPLAPANGFFAPLETAGDDGESPVDRARKAFDAVLDANGLAKQNGHEREEPEAESDDSEPAKERDESVDEEDPRVERAKKFLVRRGYDRDTVDGWDAEKVLNRKQALTQRDEDRASAVAAMRQENAELRRQMSQPREDRTTDHDDASARQAPARSSVDFSSEVEAFRDTFGPDAAKAMESFAKKIEKAYSAPNKELASRLDAIERRDRQREEADTERAITSVIAGIGTQFPELEDDPGLAADVKEEMLVLARSPRIRSIAKSQGADAAMKELAVSAARSLGLDEEDVEEETEPKAERGKSGKKPGAAMSSSRRPSPVKLTGDRAARAIFNGVLDNINRPDRVEIALRGAGYKPRSNLMR